MKQIVPCCTTDAPSQFRASPIQINEGFQNVIFYKFTTASKMRIINEVLHYIRFESQYCALKRSRHKTAGRFTVFKRAPNHGGTLDQPRQFNFLWSDPCPFLVRVYSVSSFFKCSRPIIARSYYLPRFQLIAASHQAAPVSLFSVGLPFSTLLVFLSDFGCYSSHHEHGFEPFRRWYFVGATRRAPAVWRRS